MTSELLLWAQDRCHDCIALINGDDGSFICDETGQHIEDIIQCQEWSNPDDGRI